MTNDPTARYGTPGAVALHAVTGSGVTLAEALEATGLDGACALLTTPSAYQVARVTGHTCVTRNGPVDLAAVYEARVFSPDVELRWMESASASAVVLAEDEYLLPGSFDDRLDPLPAARTIEVRYLVWGAVQDAANGWATLSSARVGVLDVPTLTAFRHGRVRLAAREYVAVDPEHGNAYVAEERLLGFEPYQASEREVEGAA
ncbi:CRISPR-associated protein Csx19 [Microbispora sp. H10670]|uniref:type III-D CRISPR-associated protein Csx19 n=1 Tax=Microbispora sp. H10670 TaxID=2729108 RepID=UPI0016016031|nr:CRISPR-associated protein Csx19 [Microbispora sp. H10670]